MTVLVKLMRAVLSWLTAERTRAQPNHEDAIDDDVLDVWLDEDEIDASGL